jgi:hypothetical protein
MIQNQKKFIYAPSRDQYSTEQQNLLTMKIKSGLIALALAASMAVGTAQENNTAAPGAASPDGQEVMPLIVIDDASLPDAIRNLARQAGLNLLFDPRALAAMTKRC